MSERAEKLIKDLTEFVGIVTADGSGADDESMFIKATQRIAELLGDNGMKPGDMVRLRSGVIYSSEPAFFNDNGEGTVNDGQLLCRNWVTLENTEHVMSDAEAHAIRNNGVPLPNVWDEEPRPEASLEERRAFVKELPELATRLKELALNKRDPELGKVAKLAQKAAEVLEAEIAPPSV